MRHSTNRCYNFNVFLYKVLGNHMGKSCGNYAKEHDKKKSKHTDIKIHQNTKRRKQDKKQGIMDLKNRPDTNE